MKIRIASRQSFSVTFLLRRAVIISSGIGSKFVGFYTVRLNLLIFRMNTFFYFP
ncbi:unnamed protein product [Meloidogyne enterolobii]|uniref:Uncharacterized protein n=1 Tax=Meloidogyne enterolobii TaxID=390850 RepID=A0ACB0YCE9_MELEN